MDEDSRLGFCALDACHQFVVAVPIITTAFFCQLVQGLSLGVGRREHGGARLKSIFPFACVDVNE